MRITELLNRGRGKVVDPEAYKREYANEIRQRIRESRIWCIDVSNPQGPEPGKK